MSPEEKQALISALGQVIIEEVTRGLEPLSKEISRLSLKIEQAEVKARELRYAGIWSDKGKYKRGNFVSHSGSLWSCLIDTETQPGKDFDAWQLCVKRGADAMGARS